MDTVRIAVDAWWTLRRGASAVSARQQARLTDLVAFARANSPFYRALYRALPPFMSDLHQLPPVTKPDLMAHFDDWVTDPSVTRAGVEAFISDKSLIGEPYLGRYMVWTTSGTTGTPAILVQDQGALKVYTVLAGIRVIPTWLDPQAMWRIARTGARIAGVYATGGHYLAVTMAERYRKGSPFGARRLRVFSVLSPLPDLVRDLNSFQPVVLGSYATALVLLAEEQRSGRLRISPLLVVSSGETLFPSARQSVESAFGCAVRETYSASEHVLMAFNCGHGWLHVNSDWTILEPVDEQYRPVAPGQPSRTVLLTNLANRVQPLIRYDLGDSITVSPTPCSCGIPLPAIRVEGRTDEILSLRTPQGLTVRIAPQALVTVVEETPGVHRFQVVQTGPSRLLLRLETTAGADREEVWKSLQARLRSFLSAQGVTEVQLELSSELPSPHPRSGKFRQVWSEYQP